MFLGKIFLIQLYIGFLEKSVKNKYASIGRVAHWAGYGNNAQSGLLNYSYQVDRFSSVKLGTHPAGNREVRFHTRFRVFSKVLRF